MSTPYDVAPPGAKAFTWSATRAAPSVSMSVTATRPPCSAIARENTEPRRPAPPVTTTTLSASIVSLRHEHFRDPKIHRGIDVEGALGRNLDGAHASLKHAGLFHHELRARDVRDR